MAENANVEDILQALDFLLEESFPGHPQPGNAFLDSGTSWQQTLESVTAGEASTSVVPGGTSIAAHLAHAIYYLRVFQDFDAGRREPVDWELSWTVRHVNEESWEVLREELDQEYQAVLRTVRERPEEWSYERIGAAFGAVAHSAYHLGAVRQMIKVIRSADPND